MKRRTVQKKIDEAVDSVKDSAKEGLRPIERETPVNFQRVLSTGSTLLDLALSGGRVHGGGCPGGIVVEVYGRSGSGKTSVLSELSGSAQAKGGEALFLDPEARLDKEYAETYGLEIPEGQPYKPDTVSEMFGYLENWSPDPKYMNVLAADSLAALSTELELKKGDKMGMRRAKEFSEGLRKYCRLIEKNNWLIACSNQIRQGDFGDVTPGGKAVEFYSSARISINRADYIEKERTLKGKKKKHKKVIGIKSRCKVTKSSIDEPYREAMVYIIFGYGIDDVRANLQYVKDVEELTKYWVGDGHDGYQRLDQAIDYIEKNDLEDMLKERVIELWHRIEEKFHHPRKKKKR